MMTFNPLAPAPFPLQMDAMTSTQDNGNPAGLDWRDGDLPVSRKHADSYYAAEDGLAETEYVFLQQNALPERFSGARTFHVAELGFGTGLSVVAAWRLWQQCAAPDGVLSVTTFEIAPLPRADMVRALGRWPELSPVAAPLFEAWDGKGGHYALPGLNLTVISGDARQTLPDAGLCADAWFLDGFAPARNPEMWGEDLMRAVFTQTRPGGTFATFTAAGHVRRALQAAGYAVERRPGFGRKREMLAGRRPD